MSMSKRWRKLEALYVRGQEDAMAGRPSAESEFRSDRLARDWYTAGYRKMAPRKEPDGVRHHAAGPHRRRGGGVR